MYKWAGRRIVFFVILFLPFVCASASLAGRYSLQNARDQDTRVFPPEKKADRIPLRQPAPVQTQGALSLTTAHFRIFWGDNYQTSDPDWEASPNNEHIPAWVDVLAAALENAYATQVNLGFSTPYGVLESDYYLDVYIANTGVVVEGVEITLSSDYYAYTDIDTEYQVSFFVFNHDFSIHTDDELGVLRVTAAHELFHAVQRVDYPWDDTVLIPDERYETEAWWLEATATWMEEVCEPDVDDYTQYIKDFLKQPARSLTDADGRREYGAAIFAGYLWLEYGGPALWQDILISMFEKGVIQAIEDALAKRGLPLLNEVVARFWSLCAHPEDTWPDGAQFLPDGVQLVFDVEMLPHQSDQALPDHYGAKLFRFPQTADTLKVFMSTLPQGTDVKLAVSIAGSNRASLEQMENDTAVLNGLLGHSLYLAIVNTGSFVSHVYSFAVEDITRVPADFDNNRIIDLSDMTLVFEILTAASPEPQIHLPSDVDDNQKITIIDSIYLLQKMSPDRQ